MKMISQGSLKPNLPSNSSKTENIYLRVVFSLQNFRCSVKKGLLQETANNSRNRKKNGFSYLEDEGRQQESSITLNCFLFKPTSAIRIPLLTI